MTASSTRKTRASRKPSGHDRPDSKMTAAESKARMEAILNTAVDAIITIDDHGLIESFNPAAEKIFGYSAKKAIGRNVSMLMPAPHRDKHDQYIRNYIKTGIAKIIGIGRETVGRRSDGTVFPIELSVSEVRIGKRLTFTGIIRDISERKRLEKAIVAVSEMERLQIGHDLHDTVGQQLAGLTMLSKAFNKKISEHFDENIPESERILELAQTALTQVKNISHGLYPVELERRGLGAALEQLALQQEELFDANCEYHGDPRTPKLDRSVAVNLYRIAQEAVGNAIKHAGAAVIAIHLHRIGDVLQLRVSDDGRGLPRKIKADRGLGLAIMKYRANMAGTELEIDSEPGKGTSITCGIPLDS